MALNAKGTLDIQESGATPPSNKSRRQVVSSPTSTEISSQGGEKDGIASSQSLTIEHNVSSSRNPRSVGLIFGLSKPVFGLVVAGILATSGAAAYFLKGWLDVPGLNNQIKDLEDQVHRLSAQVNRLEFENDRYRSLNDVLNATVVELDETNHELEMTADRLETINHALNQTNLEFSQRIAELTDQNNEYANLNGELNHTATELSSEVNRFQSAVAGLVLTNAELSNFTLNLEGLAGSLGNVAEYSNATVAALEAVLSNIVAENERLGQLNSDLSIIVSFLDKASGNFGNSFDKVAAHLSEQITANRILVLESLENVFRQRIETWDCDYSQVFFDFDFVVDRDAIVTSDEQELIIDYLEERVMEELCLDTTDFENYMEDTYPEGWSSNQLATGVLIYTGAALDYYFPEQEEVGLPPQVWADAEYKCERLPLKHRVCVMC